MRGFDNAAQLTSTLTLEVHASIGNGETDQGNAAMAVAGAIEQKAYEAMQGTTLDVDGLDDGVIVCTRRGVTETLEDAHVISSEFRITHTTLV